MIDRFSIARFRVRCVTAAQVVLSSPVAGVRQFRGGPIRLRASNLAASAA